MHPYIVTKKKLKYVVTWSPLRDHLKTTEMKIKKHLQWNHEYQRYVIDFFIFFNQSHYLVKGWINLILIKSNILW